MHIVVPTICQLSKQKIYQIIHHSFGRVYINRLKRMARNGCMENLPKNLPELEEPCPIFLLTKATKVNRGPTTYVSKFSPGFMLQMDFLFFNAERIRGFASTFDAICSAT